MSEARTLRELPFVVAPFSYTSLIYFLRFFCSTSYKISLCLLLLRQLPQKYALWRKIPTGEDMEMVFLAFYVKSCLGTGVENSFGVLLPRHIHC